MYLIKRIVTRWFPALLVMGVIFWISSQPADALPVLGWADRIVKKSGHVLGYALLAFSYWFALGMDFKRRWLVWSLAMIYAATDEIHQSLVPGRRATVWDVLIFDNLGALVTLWIATRTRGADEQPVEQAERA